MDSSERLNKVRDVAMTVYQDLGRLMLRDDVMALLDNDFYVSLLDRMAFEIVEPLDEVAKEMATR